MKVHELEKDKIITKWMRAKTKSENTKRSYLQAMQAYTDFTGMSPTELIDESEAEQIGASSIPMRKRKINDLILDFRDFLDSQNLAPMSIANRMKAVTSFYKHYYIQLPILSRSEKLVLPMEENTVIPTKDDIRKVLKIADPLEKAIILVGASSGLAVADICNLKLGDFNKGHAPDSSITTLKLRRVKTNFYFITFLTPEASQAVQAYIDFRNRIIKRENRRAKQIEKQKTVNDSGYLFIRRHVSDEYIKTHDESLRQLDESTIISIYQSLAEDARINNAFGSWNTFRSHNMRKWFNNQLKKAGCDLETKEFLMAHRTRESRGSYNAQGQDPEGLKEKFKNFIPFLTIEKPFDASESEDFKRMKAEHATLLAEAEKHRIERTELQELRAEIEKLKQSAVQKTQQKETIKRIMEEDHNQYVDPDKNWSEEYKAHRQRMANDPDYKVWYIKNQDIIYHDGIFDAGIDDENGVRLMEIEKKEAEDKNRFTNTLDKLLDKL